MINFFADVFEGVIQSVGHFCDGIIEFVGNVSDESLIQSVKSVMNHDSVGHVCEVAI